MGVAADFIADVFGGSTTEPVFLSSLPNADARAREPSERRLATRDGALVERFRADMDRKDRGTYFCVSTIKSTAKQRSKSALAELNCLFVDIDFKSVTDAPEDIERKLGQLMHLPSKVVHSGNGLHAYWIFKEALPATAENIDQIEALLSLIADHLGGDPQCCEVARLMRLPGSHNTKNGGWTEVRVIADRPLRYAHDDLADWLETTSPIIQRKPDDGGNGADPSNPWLAVATRFGNKAPVDVEARLAAMVYQGAGEAGIHATQVSVSAALINRGTPVEEVVSILLDATRAAAGAFGERWNWAREEHELRSMCETWLVKHPPGAEPEPPATPAPSPSAHAAGGNRQTGLDEWDAGDDELMPPPRGWLLGTSFCRRFVSSLFGDGGIGKTAVRYVQMLALASGRALTGERVFMRCRVLIVSLEDGPDELRRRIRAARLHHNVEQEDLKGWLFLAAIGRLAGKLMVLDRHGRPTTAGSPPASSTPSTSGRSTSSCSTRSRKPTASRKTTTPASTRSPKS
jgi:hypothetical protein